VPGELTVHVATSYSPGVTVSTMYMWSALASCSGMSEAAPALYGKTDDTVGSCGA
jgi:hypothetical protein